MKRSAFALAVLAIGFAVSPARADYAGTPWGAGWTKIAIGMPDWLIASAALSTARSQGVCR